MKPQINIELTSSQSFFENKNYNLWNNDSAPILVGIGIKTPENIGALIRLAGNVGCKKVIFVDNAGTHNLQKIKKVSTTAYNKVNWEFSNFDNWKTLLPEDYILIALETTRDSESIYKFNWPDKTALIVGSESYGIDAETLNFCYNNVYIPMIGNVKSLNVVQAAAVGLFELVRVRLTKT